MQARYALVPSLAAVVVGSLTAIQSRANGSLSDLLNNGLQAATISFSVGLILSSILVVISSSRRGGVGRLFHAVRCGDLKPWMIIGGFFGAFFVFSQSVSVPVTGVALFAVALVSGQSASALIVDKFGLGPHGRQSVTGLRVVSALVGVSAVVVAVSGRLGSADVPIVPVTISFLAGVGVSVQQAINGRVTAATAEPLVAAWWNFVVGALTLAVLLSAYVALGHGQVAALPSGPLWVYLGGVVGVVFIATASWVVGKVGVLRLSLLAIAGQLLGSLILDFAVAHTIDLPLIGGVVLAFAAVVINASARKTPKSELTSSSRPDTAIRS